MEQTRTLNIGGTREMFQDALLGKEADERLVGPLLAVMGEVASRAERRPLSIYVCSADTDNDLRNYLAFAVAKLVSGRLPDATVVDCDFLSVGLSNIVPERDALGFLDLLLYGSSLDVITQKASNAVNVIGAGSFPVSRKSPFVMDAFEETVRYLLNHTRCAIFCGPVLDDDDNIHPILGHVDLRVVVRAGKPPRPNILEPLEERVTQAIDAETWLIRVSEPTATKSWRAVSSTQPAATGDNGVGDHDSDSLRVARENANEVPPSFPQAADVDRTVPQSRRVDERAAQASAEVTARDTGTPAKPEEPAVRASEPPVEETTNAPWELNPVQDESETKPTIREPAPIAPASRSFDAGPPADEAPEWEEVREIAIDRRGGSSVFPRIMISTLGLLLVVFVVWWLYLTRSIREQIDEPVTLTENVLQSQQADTPPATDAGSTPQQAAGGNVTGAGGAADETPTEATADGQTPPGGTKTGSETTTSPAQTTTTPPVTTPPAGATQQPTVTSPSTSHNAPTGRLADYSGQHLIHVSSFRKADMAQKESDYFTGRGYAAFVAPVDLGAKGQWYRVYVGPFETSDQARRMKIRLDENPRVRSTRVTKVP
jgi:cell division protein FtsN